MMNNLYRYRGADSDSALASSVAASMAGIAPSFSSFSTDDNKSTHHHGHQKKPTSKKVVFPAANSAAGLLAPKKKLELEFRATINDDESNSDE